PAVASTTASVNDMVWGKDPEELAKINEARARELGVDAEAMKRFFGSKVLSPSRQTRLVGALYAVKARGADDYVDTAAEAKTEPQAEFFAESAEMLQRLHASRPVAAVLPDSRAMVAGVGGGGAVVLLPLDWIGWTDRTRDAVSEIDERARKELGAGRV